MVSVNSQEGGTNLSKNSDGGGRGDSRPDGQDSGFG